MALANTGYKINPRLKKVVDGGAHDGEALDVNNDLCSVSLLPQALMANSEASSDYRVLNTTDCPVTPLP